MYRAGWDGLTQSIPEGKRKLGQSCIRAGEAGLREGEGVALLLVNGCRKIFPWRGRRKKNFHAKSSTNDTKHLAPKALGKRGIRFSPALQGQEGVGVGPGGYLLLTKFYSNVGAGGWVLLGRKTTADLGINKRHNHRSLRTQNMSASAKSEEQVTGPPSYTSLVPNAPSRGQ